MSRAVLTDSSGVPKWVGRNYFGPGNPFPNGPIIDKADEVAFHHDKFYDDILKVGDQLSNSQFRTKVGEADAIAIESFIQNFRNGDITSGIGAAALSIKSAVERAIGQTIYPQKSSVTGNYG
jgi:hypothetical protein